MQQNDGYRLGSEYLRLYMRLTYLRLHMRLTYLRLADNQYTFATPVELQIVDASSKPIGIATADANPKP